ncbi:RNF216 [Lepeophtheirus salmonis]|uniref:RNF216 n=1 Tax=Lepeophtheirus salmonis TaxID=72036 RepID=A0A7R8CE10_LEPSM|nr:RNF216 [Lepeophtheirus salmonis]CAF2753902.1 RNF216 [Lepeophtheirus salmonis]
MGIHKELHKSIDDYDARKNIHMIICNTTAVNTGANPKNQKMNAVINRKIPPTANLDDIELTLYEISHKTLNFQLEVYPFTGYRVSPRHPSKYHKGNVDSLDFEILIVFKELKEPATYRDIRQRLLHYEDKDERVKLVKEEFLRSKGKIGNGLIAKNSLKRSSNDCLLLPSVPPKILNSTRSPEVIDLTSSTRSEIIELHSYLLEIFPSLDKSLLHSKSCELVGNPFKISEFIEEQTKTAINITSPLPSTSSSSFEPVASSTTPSESSQDEETAKEKEVDPQFLYEKVLEYHGRDSEFQGWISQILEGNSSGSLPSFADYEKRLQQEELIQKFSSEGDVRELVELYGNPIQHFTQRRGEVTMAYRKLSLAYLSLEFRYHRKKFIESTFISHKEIFLGAFLFLKNTKERTRKTKRLLFECTIPKELDIAFLKEYQVAKKHKVEEAKKTNSLNSCQCCFDDELLDRDMVLCPEKHKFCKECILRASEIALGEGKPGLNCLMECHTAFQLSVLQEALPANIFSKWLPRIQNVEVKDASLDGIAECPFCPYMTIMDTSPEENKLLICMNPQCGKESCRLCKELSHIPLHCDEVEKNDEVRKRTFIENKMTEALIRTCPKCQNKFFKEDGCNKITCTCGTNICYLCRKVIKTGYKHFYGQGADAQPGMCPLFSNNEKLMENDVARGAAEVSKTVYKDDDPNLAHHPNLIQDHFPGVLPQDVRREQAQSSAR